MEMHAEKVAEQWTRGDEKSEKIKVRLITEVGLVYNPTHSYKLYASGYFGKPIGINKPKPEPFKQPLQLSLYEIIYLTEKGLIEVIGKNDKKISLKQLYKIARKAHKDFQNRYKVYKDLREKGYVVRPGLKFGAHFAVYRHGPGIDHAPFLVTVYSKDSALLGIDIVRAGRLATSVRKKFVIATIMNNQIKYYTLKWHRP